MIEKNCIQKPIQETIYRANRSGGRKIYPSMQRFLVLFILLLLPPAMALPAWGEDGVPGGAGSPFEDGLKIVDAKNPDGKISTMAYFKLKAHVEDVYRMLLDVERFPEFMPNTLRVEVKGEGEGYQIVKFEGESAFFHSEIVMRRTFDDLTHRIDWHMVEGEPREVMGFWNLEPCSSGPCCHLTYSNYVDVGRLIPGGLVRQFLKGDIKEMVKNLRNRVRSGGHWKSEAYLRRVSKQ